MLHDLIVTVSVLAYYIVLGWLTIEEIINDYEE